MNKLEETGKKVTKVGLNLMGCGISLAVLIIIVLCLIVSLKAI